MNEDNEQLDLLGIFHYVVAALAALFALIPLIHLAVGIAMMTGGFGDAKCPSGPDPRMFGFFFVVLAVVVILAGQAFAVCTALAGRYLRKRTRYLFCLVMAGIECMFTPFGTVLGVFTIIVLLRPGVKRIFGRLPENGPENG